ncbi:MULTISPECIES: helix-turn-helix transcriptional regulator [unclassified Fusibacter]|uniref:helix-turn-helix domain-containing protein n=1 Tax=unclassified Fusibacter TaxID=2624464 RepID=UPI001010FD26|nr:MULTISPECIES: helix-turn-helix transcriptional regulator [unclassified Fusibacter]MCK8059010.1 helix-turn-helix domain-containing protein [Fusibacter sp. A2]NPE22421.1 helix-turn-helix domain-containing protein [Fusibacter sp. A1]RXV60527.1 helix-turn-helix domain-containing protein [Fusibacter sp. A1]
MQVRIGEVIKMHRGRKGLTQDKLAEILGVSAQAISRWENQMTYPDINLIPAIANFFGISTDELLGMDTLRNEEEISRIHSTVHRAIKSGKVDEAITELRKALKTYPNDYGFMCELAQALTIHKDYEVSKESLDEATRISELILEDCVNDKIRSTTKANLCFVYLHCGKVEAAKQLAGQLPHVWESREMIVPEMSAADFDLNKFKLGITTTLDVVYAKIKALEDDDKTSTSKLLILGQKSFEHVNFDEKMNMITKFMA